MRKWLIILLILAAIVIGGLWWLGSEVDAQKPEPGEVRMEIDNVF